ncbi:MAG: 16S rRNA processing protein RimM, partial [Oscillospiraceae bacterium]|nr:16S rRNA processing protein RimM [Oscillospiraceae bacterium]
MKKEFLEAGKIVNTHGVRGEVRILPWADSPGFLQGFSTLYIDGAPVKLLEGRVHKSFLIARFEGVTDINGAMALKNKLVSIRRSDAQLPPGDFFIQDI